MYKRGRPLGFRLSDESKKAISESKRGQKHKQETKDKISRTLINYFKRLSPLSDEILDTYCRIEDKDLFNWISEFKEELDNTNNVLTMKSIRSNSLIEISCGDNIELFYHNITPELLLLFKEYCEENNSDPLEVFDSI